MNQTVIYKGVIVKPVERVGDKVRVRTANPNDAQKVGLPFKDLEGGQAVFEALVPEADLVAVDS